MFYSNERIAYNGQGFKTAKAAKRGRFFAGSGKGGYKGGKARLVYKIERINAHLEKFTYA